MALAVLLQAVAAIPLALHLAAATSFDRALAAFPLCGGSAGDRSDTGGQPSDNHEHCLTFCQGVFGSAVLPGAVSLLVAAGFATVIFSFRHQARRTIGCIAGYASRAPPLVLA